MKKALIVGLTMMSQVALAIECPANSQRAQSIEQTKQSAIDSLVSSLDLDVDITGHPLLYKNPDAGCDLGLEMPGLPGLGFDLDFDACEVVQAVTGDMVQDLNNGMQDVVDDAVDQVGGEEAFDFDMDLGEIAVDAMEDQN